MSSNDFNGLDDSTPAPAADGGRRPLYIREIDWLADELHNSAEDMLALAADLRFLANQHSESVGLLADRLHQRIIEHLVTVSRLVTVAENGTEGEPVSFVED